MTATSSQPDRLLPIGEAAARLGLSVDTLRRWDREDAPPLRVAFRDEGGARRYSEAEVEALRQKRGAA